MTIKTKILPQTNISAGYPKLMISNINQMVVLFESESRGTILRMGAAAEHHDVRVGCFHIDFEPHIFTDFKGILELSNV